MKIAYFDCSRGISGNRIIGALLDNGVPMDYFASVIHKLLPKEKFQIDYQKLHEKGQNFTFFDVILPEYDMKLSFDQRPKRNLYDIIDLIRQSDLQQSIKSKSIDIFNRLGYAEADAHGCAIENIDFHENGAIDTIIDIVCSVAGLHYLNIDHVISSSLNVGFGTISYRYGTLPIPAPATQRLINNIPYYTNGISGELVTPTGAAIITTLTNQFIDLPPMTIESMGYGCGKKEHGSSDCLKITIGQILHESL
jgi:pyridinium-3,5-bisthiocarboxylic acid mononucleotide nickel chelatase